MKKLVLYLFLLQSLITFAQAPQRMSYQSVVRNTANQIVTNQSIGVKISIVEGSLTGTTVYAETHTTTTNANGLFTLEAGGGTPITGTFSAINWGNGSHYIKSEIDVTGGTNYTLSGTMELLSVPYALYAEKSGNDMPAGINKGDILYWNGTSWVPVPLVAETSSQSTPSSKVMRSAQVSISENGLNNGNGNGLGLALCNGVPTWGGCPLTLTTNPINQVSYTSAVSGGNITTTNNIYILASGVCYGTSHNPKVSGYKTTDGNGGSFTSTISGLLPNTIYYVRAYGTQGFGTTYGNEISFTTLPLTVPTLTTAATGNISNSTAVSGGAISSDGGAPITARGVCWSTSQNPTLTNNISSDGVGVGTFLSNMTGLNPNTTYYVRAYASNSVGTAYGNQISFTSNTVALPELTTNAITSISYTGVTGGGNVTNDGGNTITQRGVCFSSQSYPTINDNVLTIGTGIGSFSTNITGFQPNVIYYLRAFATNQGGTAYGNQVSFTTLALTTPTVTTTAVFSIASTTAASGGTIADDGGATITKKGICWSTTPNPTTQNNYTSDGAGSTTFYSALTSLALGTNYYVRAYATNSAGTAYGNQVNFTTSFTIETSSSAPVLGTTIIVKNATDYTGGGYISSNGGAPITQQGICYSTITSPTISDSVVNYTPTGNGYFKVNFSLPISCQVTYYIRAFAQNSNGVTYGNQVTLSTGLSGIFTTSPITNITGTTAISGATFSSDGGCAVTQKGVCWATTQNPTTAIYKSNCGTGMDPYSCNLTNLIPNTTYYVRAYIVNATGTYYSNQQTFTTVESTGLSIGQSYAGGIIFYLDATGEHGLVCADQDQGSYVFWGCSSISIPGTLSTIGSGAQNTAYILASCTEAYTAAQICNDLELNNYSDWFLPSKLELYTMYTNLKLNGLGNFNIDSNGYWSSTEYSSITGMAYYKNFNNTSSSSNDIKWLGKRVRAVRSF